MDICLQVLKESNKSRFDSYRVRKSVLNISQITFRDCRVHTFPTTFLEIAVYIGEENNQVWSRVRVESIACEVPELGHTIVSRFDSSAFRVQQ